MATQAFGTTMNPFDALEIHVGASAEEIKAAYHRLAKMWHPDRFTGAEKELAESKFRDIPCRRRRGKGAAFRERIAP